MKKLVLLVTTLGFIFTGQASAESSKEENIGVGTGAVVGAIAGGPVGFILGAAIGAGIGDAFHVRNQDIRDLNASLDQSQQQQQDLRKELRTAVASNDEMGDEVERLRDLARPELVNLLQAGIAMDLLFRTDEAVLMDATGSRLNQLASTLAAMPRVRIQLDGFADERGDEQYNQDLSAKRVEFVRNQLVLAGIDASRISTNAHGESIALEATADSFALERRVSLKLFIDDAQPFAANP